LIEHNGWPFNHLAVTKTPAEILGFKIMDLFVLTTTSQPMTQVGFTFRNWANSEAVRISRDGGKVE
jgi:hypothetical protein